MKLDTITMKGKINKGKLALSECVVDGPSIKMVLRGEIDLANKKMDMVALVSPLKTVDRIVGTVPVIGKLLDGAFLSVPVQVHGDMSDPEVIPLSPVAVGEEILGVMKRTFKLPITIFQPLIQPVEAGGSDNETNAEKSPETGLDESSGKSTHGSP
jgi:hypothetical protein